MVAGVLGAAAIEVAGSGVTHASALGLPPVTLPPTTLPSVTLPPTTLPPTTLPPVTLPPTTLPTVPTTIPPVTIPPVTIPPVTIPTLPPVTLPTLPVTTPAPLAPTLSVTPGSAKRKAAVVAQGTNFVPDETIVVTYMSGLRKASKASTVLCRTTVGLTGTFSCKGAIPRLARSGKRGKHTVVAAGSTGDRKTTSVNLVRRAKR
ncbi:MAG TPA: hypothetical protein VLZ77_17390 [Acidimicrobiales bacterium]|nr:hypothetical protein [Acidimicrobiales bacterium]